MVQTEAVRLFRQGTAVLVVLGEDQFAGRLVDAQNCLPVQVFGEVPNSRRAAHPICNVYKRE